MAKFSGMIGFAEQQETIPDVWEEVIVEKKYYGDVLRDIRNLQYSSNLNPDIGISNRISIIANPYAVQNFHAMRYAVYMNSKWEIKSVEVQHPRLILTLGGIYYNE